MNYIVDAYLEFFISARNGIFVGFPFLYIGFLLADYKGKINDNLLLLSGVIAVSIYLIEIFEIKNFNSIDDGALYITQLFVAPLLIIVLLRIRIKCVFSYFLRKVSSYIYFLHRLVMLLIGNINRRINIHISGIYYFILIFGICFLLASLYYVALRSRKTSQNHQMPVSGKKI